ncbi:MAG: hypothetical protein HN348_18275 [Proteobacteria bacterium]|nr:hypothetical protein [Pseudomonadota bacterium]
MASFGCIDDLESSSELSADLAMRLNVLQDAILDFVNGATLEELDDDVGLDVRAAQGIVFHRDGSDTTIDDDNPFDTIEELDAIPYVGPSALERLADYVEAQGLIQLDPCPDSVFGVRECGPRAAAILEFIATAEFIELDDDVRLDKRAAENIFDVCGSSQNKSECPVTLEELDEIPYVGQSAFDHLVAYVESLELPTEIFYRGIEPDDKVPLAEQLHDVLVEWHVALEYGEVWGVFEQIESDDAFTSDCTGIYDYYSDTCWEGPDDQCGNYSAEGDCYNREHTWPKSWWGGDKDVPQYTDLHHLYPTDGYVNMQRQSLPFGDVEKATYVSSNGSMVGSCTIDGGAGICFEPADSHKGDMARTYFYFSVRYSDSFAEDTVATTANGGLKPWQEDLLREWHELDPVSDDERHRNNQIFLNYQNTRNPFIDYPEWVASVDF